MAKPLNGSYVGKQALTTGSSKPSRPTTSKTITVTPSLATIQAGQTVQLTANRTGVQWVTANAAIATVSSTGLVTGVAAGNTVITAKLQNNRGTAQVIVQAVPPVDSGTRGPTADITQPSGAVVLAAGADIQAAITANPAGTTFWLQAGTYHILASMTPKSGDVIVGEYGAILDGTGWTTTNREDAFFKSVNNGITNVTIRNLVIRNGPEYGVNAYLTASGWLIEHCEISGNRNGVSVGVNGVINKNLIHHNIGTLDDPDTSLRGGGYALNSAMGASITDNEISYNGQEQKIIYGTTNEPNHNVTVRDNFVHHNVKDGLWIDGDGAGSIIENNVVEDNGRTGITVEIGNNVIVRNNIVRRHANAEGILISASRSCTVSGNTLEGNLFGLGLFLDFTRLTETYPFWTVDLTNNNLNGNTVRVPIGPGTFASLLTTSGAGDATPYLSNAKNNNFQSNTYYVPNNPTSGTNWFVWNGNKLFSQWQALPQDTLGTIAIGSVTGAYGPTTGITRPSGAVVITSGADIQAAVTANPAGTTFWLQAGTYNLVASITPKSGDVFVGEYGAVLDGSGWTTTDTSQAAFRASNQDIDNVTIRNLVIQHMPQKGIGVLYNLTSGWTIEYCELRYNKYGLAPTSDSIVRHCYIHHNVGDINSQIPEENGGGFINYNITNTLYDTNEIAFNGPEMKTISSGYVTFRNNYFHDNVASGIWFDGPNAFSVIEGNTVNDHATQGIVLEVSNDIIIRNNIVRRAQTAISLSLAQRIEIYGNTLEDNYRGITYFADGARAINEGWDLADDNSHNNTIRVSTQSGAYGAMLFLINATADQITAWTNGSKHLIWQSNTYAVPTVGATWYYWNGATKTFTQWQALGNDAGSTETAR